MVFVLQKIGVKKMEFLSKKLVKDEKFENRIKLICSYNYANCKIKQGRIISIKKTNISFIELHKIIIKISNYAFLIIYYDKDNLFLYDRSMPISLKVLNCY